MKLLAELTGNAIGLDIAPTAVANCRAKGFRAFHEDFLTHSGVYDLVLSDGLIEHFEDFRPYVAGLCRLSGRYVMIIQTNHASFVTQILLFLERVIKPGINVPEYPHHVSAFIDDFSSHSFPLVGQRSILCGVSKILLFEKASGHTRND